MGVGVSVGLALCLSALLVSSPQVLCVDSEASYVPGAYLQARRVWPFPAALCTTGVVGESSDTEVVVDWGMAVLLLLGVALAGLSIRAFRKEGAGRV